MKNRAGVCRKNGSRKTELEKDKIRNGNRDTAVSVRRLLPEETARDALLKRAAGQVLALSFRFLGLVGRSLDGRAVLHAVLKAANAFGQPFSEFRQFPGPEQQ